ncbi:RNA-splicing ligase RtcB [Cnuibacter physcomitrellae]|uniref:3'-phosphate/5'-hydroxy nucleic acid ligase n=1 Tax=Cnuibacter physcomitrellae TaxID=1619308 RepID=A0A1X9LMD1_9MICO|nr:RtcB family protein [Cnuibacter physcomitrellae]ARJ06267.1 RNA-splicing ligase RtcB [Cnuibacter physcomitrellae]GGI37614.1 RNA-splicing ligase RtcB [Cnuibacter physcomitrellae]
MERITERLLSWASILDPNAREQAITTAAMPFIHPHVALMPDAHLGKGATVGSVIPTLGAIIPAAVGVDIGCGMIAVRTQFTAGDLPADDAGFDPASYAANWVLQLGSLGSGNHFIEVSLDELDRVWLFLHSGSRGVGNKIATHHIAVAQERCLRDGVTLPDRDLAFLEEGTEEFDRYIAELRWAQEFALQNREEMMDRVVAALADWGPVDELERVNCHHNYTERETHFGEEVWLSRKGAIDASAGRPGLIPGSMGTRSYVVVGRGDADSLHSSPHGAGREYSRTKARKTFTRDQLDEAMAGIEWIRSDAFLDEIPQAYKPIDRVMADAADLVEIRHELRQLVNVKGD